MSKPTILVVPGSFSPLSAYDPIIAGLESYGYTVYGIELETVGRRDKAPGMYDDAAKVAARAAQLADAGAEVALVAHSYGGLVACEAAKGLAKSVRAQEGKQGGIVRIVFVTAVVPRVGESMVDIMGAVTQDYVALEGEYLVITDPAKAAPITFSDLPPAEAVTWASKLSTHSAVSFGQKLTYAAHKDIPISYLLCEADKLVTPEQQNKIIAGLEGEMGAGKSVDRHPVKADHAINASQPEAVVKVVRRALGETV